MKENGRPRELFPVRRFRGITLRVALLGWTVTLGTLAVFLTVIIPQQEVEFRMNLESKARGVAASIKGVAAGAAVSEDYSAVVEQAMQVLSGDQAIDFLVITKNDGFSVVTERSKWRTERLGEGWRPAKRVAGGRIETVPLFGRRVFHYATPLDYSGIEWGWVHIGLSLDAYDESRRRSDTRTIQVAAFCGGFSLLVSLLCAQRLVKPIHMLHGTVEKVGRGDLQARSGIRTADEIGQLATAFDSMTEAILARNRILESVGFAAQELLRAPDWTTSMEAILERVGRAAGASRAYVFENESEGGVLVSSLREEWRRPDVGGTRNRWQKFPWRGGGLDEWGETLRNNGIVTAKPAALPEQMRRLLGADIRSLIAFPIIVGDGWWGFLGFDDCVHERDWGEAEMESLRAVANMLGSTILRRRAQAELVESNNTLERRVAERTRELQEQVVARERANAELAAAQQRLVTLSRQAGMAEVATGVLHNVGNVLNSVNVAATLVLERVRHSRIDRLASVAGLLEEHKEDLGEFLGRDPKGSQVVPYLITLAGHLARERQGAIAELDNLSRHVGHIKEIVAAQQGYATTAGFIEQVPLRKLVEDAIALSKDGMDRHGVAVELSVEEMPDVFTDKHKVLQIVLNLMRNAKHATIGSSNASKKVRLTVRRSRVERFVIEVEDNGVGLRPEHLQRVFQHGFTTKAGGHGFGLHSSALAAADLGGKLSVESEGPGRGARFTLELPLRASLPGERSV